jgi:uncharacterized NAD-dependent epimerase/dehydratase family protein
MLLLADSLYSLHLKTMISSAIATTMVEHRPQGKSRASKEEQKGARECINRTVETLSIFRHNRVAHIRLRLEDVMWSHGG